MISRIGKNRDAFVVLSSRAEQRDPTDVDHMQLIVHLRGQLDALVVLKSACSFPCRYYEYKYPVH